MTYLLGAATEHALYAQTHRHDIHGRAPVLVQDREADVTIAIYVRVNRDLVSTENNLHVCVCHYSHLLYLKAHCYSLEVNRMDTLN